jgi:hypothetical protein
MVTSGRCALSRVDASGGKAHSAIVTSEHLHRGFAIAVLVASVISDKFLTGPKKLKKVNSSVFAGLENAQ